MSRSLLQVDIGQFTTAGTKPLNEDAVQIGIPEQEAVRAAKGLAVALADGVSSAEAGREASLMAVREFLTDYFRTPETWSVRHAGEKTLSTVNHQLYRRSHEFVQQEKGYLCTFCGVILKSRTAHLFHVGDSRIYHLTEAGGQAERSTSGGLHLLTRDHVATLGQGHRILARALGMDSQVVVDYDALSLREGDWLLLTTDGVHDFLNETRMRDLMLASASAQQAAEQLVESALLAGSDDNLSAVVLRVQALPENSLEELSHELTRLPFPPDLHPGVIIDGLEVLEELFASPRSQLYRVRDQATGQIHVMKTPSRNYEDDLGYIDRFVQEEWIGQRINSPRVVRITRQSQPRRFLYYLMEPVTGVSLETWMQQNRQPRPKRAIGLVRQIAEGLRALHRQDTIHQDLKPANIMVSDDDRVTLVDFGSVYVAGIAEMDRPLRHEGALGTAAYADPHYLIGHNSGVQGDLYALATMTYELFTGELPYGEGINECRTWFDYDRLRYRSASRFNPVIPHWFDRTLEKGVSFSLDERYASLDSFLQDLQHPNPAFVRDDPEIRADRSPVLFWQMLSGFWALLLVLVVTLFSCQAKSPDTGPGAGSDPPRAFPSSQQRSD